MSDHVYLIPMLSVYEMLSPNLDKVKYIEGRQEVILVRNEYVPIYRIHDLLGVKFEHKGLDKGILVIVTSGGNKMALFVDEVLGEQQVVLKPLAQNLKKNPAVSSATILGDGSVALILDVEGLKEATNRHQDLTQHADVNKIIPTISDEDLEHNN